MIMVSHLLSPLIFVRLHSATIFSGGGSSSPKTIRKIEKELHDYRIDGGTLLCNRPPLTTPFFRGCLTLILKMRSSVDFG